MLSSDYLNVIFLFIAKLVVYLTTLNDFLKVIFPVLFLLTGEMEKDLFFQKFERPLFFSFFFFFR